MLKSNDLGIQKKLYQRFPPLLFNTDLRNNKQTIKNPRAATPPTASATVLSVCGCPPPPPIQKPNTQNIQSFY